MTGLMRERILSQLQAVGAPPDLIAGFQEAAETLHLIDALRESEGNSVEIFCDNPEPQSAEDRNGITCNCDFTNWEEKQYNGESLLACLRKAAADMRGQNQGLRKSEDKRTE